MQLALNERSTSNVIYTNVAIDHHIYNFENENLIIQRNIDKIIPEYIILNLHDNNISLDTIYNYGRNMYIDFKLGNQTFLKIPLSILWNLKEPELYDDKLYIEIPFEMFFGNIHLIGLDFRIVNFTLVNYNHLINYVESYSLLCKRFVGDLTYRRNNRDTSYCCIQQISSIEVNVSLNNMESASNEFKIRTKFNGFSKGFFIESNNINDLNEIKFYINEQIKINYNRFMIRNKCQRINNNMIFLPFNDDIIFRERNVHSFVGSINLSETNSSILNLIFDTQHSKVKIYSINLNKYSQRNSVICDFEHIINNHCIEDFENHPLTPIDENNIIINNIPNMYNNIIYNNYNNLYNNIGMTGPNPNMYAMNINNLIVNSGIYRLIPEDRRICGISLDEIAANQSYMFCIHCSNNFNEQSIITWLINRTTCPSCRREWENFNIYINANPIEN